jgi:UDP-N-acetylglucosamine 2-epimerase
MGRPYSVVSVVGTRPEAIKLVPLVRALAECPDIRQAVILTGQHKGLEGEFAMLPSHAVHTLPLDPSGRSIHALQAAIRRQVCGHLALCPAELVIVQGDTNSAVAGALAARDCNLPIAHVEAGLRSFDLAQPYPEEGNRIAIDAIADLLFAPTDVAARNLVAEPAVKGSIHVTGNTGIDALLHARTGAGSSDDRRTVLVTCHRHENAAALREICRALEKIATELPVEVIFLLHPNRHRQRAIRALIPSWSRVRLLAPVPHREMVRMMEQSWLILTDSGGLQEEGPALGRPVLVMRNVTERAEATENVRLVGSNADGIVSAVNRLLMDDTAYQEMARPAFPFGDGSAAPRIAAIIRDWLAAQDREAA